MAERRMVSKAVLHSPSFLAMPVAAQMLYVHLELFADDDGFVATPLQVARMMGIPKRFYQILVDQAFVIHFDSGVCVIRHWLQHNKVSPADTTQRSMKQKKLACGQRAGPTVCVIMMQT